jgi:hypothetical protein
MDPRTGWHHGDAGGEFWAASGIAPARIAAQTRMVSGDYFSPSKTTIITKSQIHSSSSAQTLIFEFESDMPSRAVRLSGARPRPGWSEINVTPRWPPGLSELVWVVRSCISRLGHPSPLPGLFVSIRFSDDRRFAVFRFLFLVILNVIIVVVRIGGGIVSTSKAARSGPSRKPLPPPVMCAFTGARVDAAVRWSSRPHLRCKSRCRSSGGVVLPSATQLSMVWLNSGSNSNLKSSDNVLLYAPAGGSPHNAQQLAA